MDLIKLIEYSAMGITLIGAYPLYKEYKKYQTRMKNKISDSTFTDRINDIKTIINMINSGEDFILITGTDDIKGKTWLSKKICDCINHSSVMCEYDIGRCNKKRAFYFDLNSRTMDSIEKNLLDNCVNSKTLCIFDNCSIDDINTIKNKALLLNFASIIILSEISDIEISDIIVDIKNYKISEFPIKQINQLQNKIVDKFPKIDYLSKEEINILYELTNGNIKKIYFIISSQKTVLWIKQISKNKRTEYDDKLNKIQVLLFQGLYEEAKKEIEKLQLNDKEYINVNNDYFSKFVLLKADCYHLLNQYNEAIHHIQILLNSSQYNVYNVNNIFELHLGHFYKHIWESDLSIEILNNISKSNDVASLEILGVLSCKYFIDEEIQGFNGMTTMELYKSLIIRLTNKEENQPQRLERHKIILDFYNNANLGDLISRINDVISAYKAENNRLVANAVFLKGELYRLNKKYDEAVSCYIDTLTYTNDDNTKIQVNVMLYYLIQIKKIHIDGTFIAIDEIISLCHMHNNNYGKRLIQKINSIKLEDSNYEHIIKCFDERIMTIL